jgi:hypothetical protein
MVVIQTFEVNIHRNKPVRGNSISIVSTTDRSLGLTTI